MDFAIHLASLAESPLSCHNQYMSFLPHELLPSSLHSYFLSGTSLHSLNLQTWKKKSFISLLKLFQAIKQHILKLFWQLFLKWLISCSLSPLSHHNESIEQFAPGLVCPSSIRRPLAPRGVPLLFRELVCFPLPELAVQPYAPLRAGWPKSWNAHLFSGNNLNASHSLHRAHAFPHRRNCLANFRTWQLLLFLFLFLLSALLFYHHLSLF